MCSDGATVSHNCVLVIRSSPWRWLEYRPKHVGKIHHIWKFTCSLFVYFWIWLLHGRRDALKLTKLAYNQVVVFEWFCVCVTQRGDRGRACLNVKTGGTWSSHWFLQGQSIFFFFPCNSFIAKSAACRNRTFLNRQQTSSECNCLRSRLRQGVLTHGQMNRKLQEWKNNNKNKKVILCVYLASAAVGG